MSSNDIQSVRMTFKELSDYLEAAQNRKLNARQHPFAFHLGMVNFSQELPDTIKPDPGLTELANHTISLGPVEFAELVLDELARARGMYPKPQNSAHEGYSVLAEEVDELWDLVRGRTRRTDGSGGRDPSAMLAELVQIGAMAQRMAEDVVLNKQFV